MIALIFMASTLAAGTSSLEQMSAIVAPYTLCEIDGKASLKLKADEWSAAAQASNKNPDDIELKARSTELFKQLQTSSQAVRDGCGYEGVHKTLQARISRLHPKMSDAEAFWFARNVFSSLNNLNEHIIEFERGEFPPAPPPPPR